MQKTRKHCTHFTTQTHEHKLYTLHCIHKYNTHYHTHVHHTLHTLHKHNDTHRQTDGHNHTHTHKYTRLHTRTPWCVIAHSHLLRVHDISKQPIEIDRPPHLLRPRPGAEERRELQPHHNQRHQPLVSVLKGPPKTAPVFARMTTDAQRKAVALSHSRRVPVSRPAPRCRHRRLRRGLGICSTRHHAMQVELHWK